MEIKVSNFTFEIPPTHAMEIFVSVWVNLEIWVDDILLDREVEFTVIELCAQLRDWMEENPRPDYHYTSIALEDDDYIKFVGAGDGFWSIVARNQVAACPRRIPTREIDQAIHRLLDEVIDHLPPLHRIF